MKKPSKEFLARLHARHREIDEMTAGFSYEDMLYIEPWWYGDYYIRVAFPALEDESRWLPVYGTHGNVLPNTGGNRPQIIGCPRVTWGKTCAVCEAIDWGLSSGIITNDEVSGMGGFKVNRRFLLPVWWTDFKFNKDQNRSKRLPEFGEFPQFKVFGIRSSVAKKFETLGPEEGSKRDYNAWDLLDPEDGVVLKIVKDENIDGYWDMITTRDKEEVPDDIIEQANELDFDQLIRDELFGGHDDVEGYVENIVRGQISNVPEVVANYLETTDVDHRALPPGKEEEPEEDDDEKPRGRRSGRFRGGSKKNRKR